MEAKVDSWQVQVVANGEPVLTIGDNFLSGHNDIDDYVTLIRNCAEHLLAFTGQSITPCTYPDCVSARAVRVAGDSYQPGYVEGLEKAAGIAEGIGKYLSCTKDTHGIIEAIRAATPVAEVCEWVYDDCEHAPKWDTSCGEAWCFIEGGPEENRVRYCHGCGRVVEVKECP